MLRRREWACLAGGALLLAGLVAGAASRETDAPSPVASACSRLVLLQGAVGAEGRVCIDGAMTVGDLLQGAGCAAIDGGSDLARAGERIEVVRGGDGHCAVRREALPGEAIVALGGRIDVNRAGAVALQAVPGIGPATAASILDERNLHGPFSNVQELTRVRGLGPVRVQGLAPYVDARP